MYHRSESRRRARRCHRRTGAGSSFLGFRWPSLPCCARMTEACASREFRAAEMDEREGCLGAGEMCAVLLERLADLYVRGSHAQGRACSSAVLMIVRPAK